MILRPSTNVLYIDKDGDKVIYDECLSYDNNVNQLEYIVGMLDQSLQSAYLCFFANVWAFMNQIVKEQHMLVMIDIFQSYEIRDQTDQIDYVGHVNHLSQVAT